MKSTLTTLLWTIVISCSAQIGVYNQIQPNHIKTGMWSHGPMFWDLQRAQFQVPYTGADSPSIIFAGGIWLSGYDEDDQLHIVYQKYLEEDYIPGPTNAHTIPTDLNQVWTISKADIEAHLQDFGENSSIDQPRAAILNWPSSGNSHLDLPIQRLAPFYDSNNNDIYEPMLGEHPILFIDNQTVIPEEMAYTVYHSTHGYEVHSILYGLNEEGNDLTNNSLFLQHTIYNKTAHHLSNFSYGLWIDPDIGCNKDDYAGSIPSKNAFIAYNMDDIDGPDNEDDLCSGVPAYDDPPMMTCTLLNQPLDLLAMFYYHSWLDFPGEVTHPQTEEQHQSYLDGYWLNGEAFTNAGMGSRGDSIVKHLFPGDPNKSDEWSMVTAEVNGENNANVLAVTKQAELAIDASITIDAVINYTNEPGHLTDYQKALDNIDRLQALYDEAFSPFQNSNSSEQLKGNIVFPNPTDSNLKLNSSTTFQTYTIYDLVGRKMQTGPVDDASISFDLPSGSYVLELANRKETIFEKFIVQ